LAPELGGDVFADAPNGATDVSQQHAGVDFVAADVLPVFAVKWDA
jgi:hypothetical protein